MRLCASYNACDPESPNPRYHHRRRPLSIYQRHSEMGSYEDVSWVCTKRLEKSTFGWPTGEGPSRCLRPEELNLLIHGWEGTPRPQWYWHKLLLHDSFYFSLDSGFPFRH